MVDIKDNISRICLLQAGVLRTEGEVLVPRCEVYDGRHRRPEHCVGNSNQRRTFLKP